MVMKNGFLTATLEEGEGVLLERARARIDEEETGAPSPTSKSNPSFDP